MGSIVENLSRFTVRVITDFYEMLAVNSYFILSNIFGIVVLLIFQISFNNLLLFILPIFLLIQSILMQFRVLQNKNIYSLRFYFKDYIYVLMSNWKLLLVATLIILLLIIDLKIILSISSLSVLLGMILITSGFVLNSVFYLLLFQTQEEGNQIPLSKKLVSALLLSYRFLFRTFLNICYIAISIVCLEYFSGFYIIFVGGFMNLLIWKNLQKGFSLSLFYEQQIG